MVSFYTKKIKIIALFSLLIVYTLVLYLVRDLYLRELHIQKCDALDATINGDDDINSDEIPPMFMCYRSVYKTLMICVTLIYILACVIKAHTDYLKLLRCYVVEEIKERADDIESEIDEVEQPLHTEFTVNEFI